MYNIHQVHILNNYFKIKRGYKDKTEYFKRVCKEAGFNYYFLIIFKFIKQFDYFNILDNTWLCLLKTKACGTTTYYIKNILEESYRGVKTQVVTGDVGKINAFINSTNLGFFGIELYNDHFRLPLLVQNHSFVIEKASSNLFIIYQSFAKFYDLGTYLDTHKHFYSLEEIKEFFNELGVLQIDPSSERANIIFKKWFHVDLCKLGAIDRSDRFLIKMFLIEKI